MRYNDILSNVFGWEGIGGDKRVVAKGLQVGKTVGDKEKQKGKSYGRNVSRDKSGN